MSTPDVTDDDLFQPIRALNDLLFCARRCALHRTEQLWVENVFTAEGSIAHRKVHQPSKRDADELGSAHVSRGMRLRSARLRLVGVADLVEFRPEPYPVEYKRGPRRRWDNDDVQLCAQALCLEEMLHLTVPAGAVFHVRSRRRREVVFDADLRRRTEQAVADLHALLDSRQTPPPVLHKKCQSCSLYAACMPELLAQPDRLRRAAINLFVVCPE